MKKAPFEPQLLPDGYYHTVHKGAERPMLTITQHWPRPAGDSPGLRRIRRYYETLAQRWRRRWEGPLLAEAKAADPERPWAAELSYHLTLLDQEHLSLWWEAREDVGGRPRRLREGEVWHLADGIPLTLPQLLPCPKNWKNQVITEVEKQIKTQLADGESLYYGDWPQLCRRYLSPHRCWLTPEGPVVFFPICSIAPALEDFPAFPLPLAAD